MLECDLVMKGGVTSGTVYPKAIVRLAKDYRLRSIGGTSAGAIAAAAAAAAEYYRQTKGAANPKAGFEALAGLPDELGTPGAKKTGTTLLELFQPQRELRSLFAFFLSFIGQERTSKGEAKQPGRLSRVATWMLIGRVCVKAIYHFPVYALAGVIAALVLAWALGVSLQPAWRVLVLAGFVSAGAAAFALWGVWRAVQKLPANGFGLCQGFEPAPKDSPEDGTHLTPWLDALLQRTAGLKLDDTLTFGKLDGANVELRVITSNLCYGLPHRLPFRRGEAWPFFDEEEWSRLFPRAIVAHLKRHPPRRATQPENANDRQYAEAVKSIGLEQKLFPLPESEDLPVIVAVRMSLSFPLLLSAIPLHLLDPREHASGRAKKCWFSDGGISSNFPLHFFDSPVPDRPTFAINLNEVERVAAPGERVVLPRTNREGLARAWRGIAEDKGESVALAEFLLAIFNVMQNWRDNALLRLPGYRDRVAAIQLEPHQGGLNLNMPRNLIAALSGYGEQAADRLAFHFLPQNAAACRSQGIETTWENHRWVRLLCTLAGLEKLVEELKHVWKAQAENVASYRDLLDPAATPESPSYPEFTDAQKRRALECLEQAGKAIDACREAFPAEPMSAHTPRPVLHFRLTAEA